MREFSRLEIAQRVRGILAYQVGCRVDQMQETAALSGLASPMSFVEALSVIRQSFEISLSTLSTAQVSDQTTVGELIDFVDRAVSSRRPSGEPLVNPKS